MTAKAGGYKVQLDELGKLINTLDEAANQITEANKTLSAMGQLRGMMGNETLADEAQAFEDTWEYGIEKLGEAATDVSERLVAVKDNYQKLEELNAELLAGGK